MSDKQPTISKKELIETCGYISQTRLNQWLTWLTTPDMQTVIIPYRYTPKNGKIALQQAEWMRTEHNNSKTRYIVDACAEKLARDDAGNSVLLFEQLVVHTGKPLTLTEIRRQLKCQNIRLSRHMRLATIACILFRLYRAGRRPGLHITRPHWTSKFRRTESIVTRWRQS